MRTVRLGLVLLVPLAGIARGDDSLAGRWEQTYPPGDDQAVLVLEDVPGPGERRHVEGRLTIEGQTVEVAFVDDAYGNWFGGYELPGQPGVGVLIGRQGKDQICFQAHHGEVSKNRTMRRVSRDGSPRPPPPPERPPAPAPAPTRPADEARPARPRGPWDPGTVVEVEVQVVTRDLVRTRRPGAAEATTDTQTRLDATYQDTVQAVDDDGRPTRVERAFLRSTRTVDGRAEKTELEGKKALLAAPTPGRWRATIDGREPTGPAARALAAALIPEDPATWRLADGSQRHELERLNRGQAPADWPQVVRQALGEFSYNVTQGSWSTDVSGAPARCRAELTITATQRMSTPEGERATERTRQVTVVQLMRTLIEGTPPPPRPAAAAPPPAPGAQAGRPAERPGGKLIRADARASHVRVGQRYVFTAPRQHYVVLSIGDFVIEHLVESWYHDDPKPHVGRGGLPKVGVRRSPQLPRERIVVSGIEFLCAVETYDNGATFWWAIDEAGNEVYPWIIRQRGGPDGDGGLVRIEGP